MDKAEARYILKNTGYIGNEVGVAFDVAIKSMDKLEKIENDAKLTVEAIAELQEKLEKIKQVVNEWNEDASKSFGDMCKIKGILKE